MKAFEVLKALHHSGPQVPLHKLAVITTLDAATNTVKVTFEGEDEEADIVFPWLGSYTPRLNDRVLLDRVGSTWVILDNVTTTEGLWKILPLVSPWVGDPTFEPHYMLKSNMILFKGRATRGGSLAGPSTVDVTTVPGITRGYTGAQTFGTWLAQTANTTHSPKTIRMNTTGLMQIIVPSGETMQQYIHFDGLSFHRD